MNVYEFTGGEWLIVAHCAGPISARWRKAELEAAYPKREFIVADELPRGGSLR
jgi:hypothetical protein